MCPLGSQHHSAKSALLLLLQAREFHQHLRNFFAVRFLDCRVVQRSKQLVDLTGIGGVMR